MRSLISIASLATVALAASTFLDQPDTGLETYLYRTNYTDGTLPLLKDMRGIPDFDWAARQYMDHQKYAFYRTATAGEWSKTILPPPLSVLCLITDHCKQATVTTSRSGARPSSDLASWSMSLSLTRLYRELWFGLVFQTIVN